MQMMGGEGRVCVQIFPGPQGRETGEGKEKVLEASRSPNSCIRKNIRD